MRKSSTTRKTLSWPAAIEFDAHGNLFIADTGNHRVRRIDSQTGIITTVAGTGEHALAAIGLSGLDPSEGELENLSIGPETLTTSRFEALLQQIERSAFCRRVSEAVEQRLHAAYECR